MPSRTSGRRATSATKRATSTRKKRVEPGSPGDLTTTLLEIQRALRVELANAGGSHLANVARELRIVSEKLDDLKPKKASVLDEIADRRNKRRAAAAGS